MTLILIKNIKNGNLQEELDNNVKSSIYIKTDRVVKLFQGVCNGVNYIHELNLAHRDLKPQNILLSDDRQLAVLTDFGSMTEKVIEIESSKKAKEIEDWAAQNCSMFYKAPELFSSKFGSSINESADVWSLGCILYALMYNKGPFDYVCERGDSIALAVLNAKYSIPNQTRDDILLKILKATLVFEAFERESLRNILSDLNQIQLKNSNENEIA